MLHHKIGANFLHHFFYCFFLTIGDKKHCKKGICNFYTSIIQSRCPNILSFPFSFLHHQWDKEDCGMECHKEKWELKTKIANKVGWSGWSWHKDLEEDTSVSVVRIAESLQCRQSSVPGRRRTPGVWRRWWWRWSGAGRPGLVRQPGPGTRARLGHTMVQVNFLLTCSSPHQHQPGHLLISLVPTFSPAEDTTIPPLFRLTDCCWSPHRGRTRSYDEVSLQKGVDLLTAYCQTRESAAHLDSCSSAPEHQDFSRIISRQSHRMCCYVLT